MDCGDNILNARVDELKYLYKDAFLDPEQYVDYFFQEKYKEENTIAYAKNNEILSVMYLIYKKLSYMGRIIDVPYIVAASTKSKYRGHKLFENVMFSGINVLVERQVPFVFLYPVNRNYYKRYGFDNSDFCIEKKEVVFKGEREHVTIESYDAERYSKIYNKFVMDLDVFIYRDVEIFQKRLNELQAEEGKAYIITNKSGYDVGYIFKTPKEADEVILADPFIKMSSLQVLEGLNLSIYSPIVDSYNCMGRICSYPAAFSLLDASALPNLSIEFMVKDQFLGDQIFKLYARGNVLRLDKSSSYDFSITTENLFSLFMRGEAEGKYPREFTNLFTAQKTCLVDHF